MSGTKTYAAVGTYSVQIEIFRTLNGSAVVNNSIDVSDGIILRLTDPSGVDEELPRLQDDQQPRQNDALARAVQQAIMGIQDGVAVTPWSAEENADGWLAGLVNAVDIGPADSLPSGLVFQVGPVKEEAASSATILAGTQARDSTAGADERTEPGQIRIVADASGTGQVDTLAAAQASNVRVRDALFVALAGEGWSEEAAVDDSTTAAANDTVFAATFLDDLFADA